MQPYSVAKAATQESPVAMNSNQTSTVPPATETLFVKFLPNTPESERMSVITDQYEGELVRWLSQLDTAIVRVATTTARRILPPSEPTSSADPLPAGDAAVREPTGAIAQLLSFFMRLFGILTEGAESTPTAPQEAAAPLSRAVTRIEADGVVQGCEDNTVDPPPVFEANDPDLGLAYGLNQIRATDAWAHSVGTGCTVAVVDTGINRDHPEFQGRVDAGYNFVADTDQPEDDNGHGTHVAGIIGAAVNNSQGAAGSAPDCRIVPVKVLDNNNLGTWSDVVSGILFAVESGADIINLSLGASSVPPETVQEAIEVAVANAVVVAAAGNAATTQRFYPASYDGVVSVAGTSQDGERWIPSNYGSWITVAAPAENVYATALGQSYEYRSGTSMAAGFVSGTCALIHQAGFREADAMIQRLTVSAIEVTGGDATNRELGAGQIDALGAVTGAQEQIFFPIVT